LKSPIVGLAGESATVTNIDNPAPGGDPTSERPAASSSQEATEAEAFGFLDGFVPPRRFFGWAAFREPPFDTDARVVVRLGEEIVAEGKREFARHDVTTAEQPVGFHLVAHCDVDHEAIADGLLSVEIVGGGRRGFLYLPPSLAQSSRLFLALKHLAAHDGWDKATLSVLGHFIRPLDGADDLQRKMLAMLAVLNESTPKSFLADLASFAASGVRARSLPREKRALAEMSDPEVLAHFESIGFNCEFGFVQRIFGYEPTSFLRWTSMPAGLLVEGLRNEFAGVGEPEYTKFAPLWEDGEYATSDTRYDLTAHTMSYRVAPEHFDREFQKHCKRLAWLKRAFLESLQDAPRILVRVDYDPLSMRQIGELFQELTRYGRNRLLVVRADPEKEGAVEPLQDGLYVGYVRAFSRPEAVPQHVDGVTWMKLLRNALAVIS